MRKLVMLMILVVAAAMITALASSDAVRNKARAESHRAATKHAAHEARPATQQDPVGTVHGANNPEMIPDRVAFMLMFRFISEVDGDAEKSAMREYVRIQMGLGKQPQTPCPPADGFTDLNDPPVGSEDQDIDALMAAAESFKQQVALLDNQAKEIKDRSWPEPSPEVMEQLTKLQRQKERLADRVIATLPGKLSAGGLERVNKHVRHRVKSFTKKFPGPPTLPRGEGWKTSPAGRHH